MRFRGFVGIVSLFMIPGWAGDYTPVYRAAQPVVIDGKLDEPIWQRSVRIEIDYRYSGAGGNRAEKSPGYARVAWDEHYLYLGYETFDTDLRAAPSGEIGGKGRNVRIGAEIGGVWDVVEIFISLNQDPEHFWEIHHNPLNHFNDIYIIVPSDPQSPLGRSLPSGIRFITGDDIAGEDPRFTLATAISLVPVVDPETGEVSASTVNNPYDTDQGYRGEIRLPWGGIGADWSLRDGQTQAWNMSGQILKLLHVIQDGGLSERYAETLFHSSPTKPSGWFHKGYEHWPAFRLEESPPAE